MFTNLSLQIGKLWIKKTQLSRFSLYLQLNGSVTSGWTDYITICFKCPRAYFFNFNFSDSLKHSVNK